MSLFSLLVLLILPFSDSFVFDPELTDRLDAIIQNQVCSKIIFKRDPSRFYGFVFSFLGRYPQSRIKVTFCIKVICKLKSHSLCH